MSAPTALTHAAAAAGPGRATRLVALARYSDDLARGLDNGHVVLVVGFERRVRQVVGALGLGGPTGG